MGTIPSRNGIVYIKHRHVVMDGMLETVPSITFERCGLDLSHPAASPTCSAKTHILNLSRAWTTFPLCRTRSGLLLAQFRSSIRSYDAASSPEHQWKSSRAGRAPSSPSPIVGTPGDRPTHLLTVHGAGGSVAVSGQVSTTSAGAKQTRLSSFVRRLSS